MFDDHASRDVAYSLVGAWIDAAAHLASGALRANAAFLSRLTRDGVAEAPAGSLAYTDEAWTTETDVATPAAVSVGDRVTFRRRLTEEDVRAFAAASGDTNRLHLDDEYAEASRFEGRIAHGTLVGGLISAALARLPGLTVYLSQELEFLAPVDVGDEVTAVVEVVEDLGGGRYRLTTEVFQDEDEQVVDGEAVVLVDDAPDFEP